MARWLQHTGKRVLVIVEGRDTAGKGGVDLGDLRRLNPRQCHVVALPKPNERERRSGISSATSRTCRRPAKSCCSIAAGTTAPASRR